MADRPGTSHTRHGQRRAVRLAYLRRVVWRQARIPCRSGGVGTVVCLRSPVQPPVLPDLSQVQIQAAILRAQAGGQRRCFRETVQGQAVEEDQAGPQNIAAASVGSQDWPSLSGPRWQTHPADLLADRRQERRYWREEVFHFQCPGQNSPPDADESRLHPGGNRACVSSGKDRDWLRSLRGAQLSGTDKTHDSLPTGPV